jgi:serine/threonine protein kinase
MAGDSPCPDLDTLLLLSSGQLPESQSATLNQHVEQCPTCTQALNSNGRSKSQTQSARIGKAGLAPTVMEKVEPFSPPITWQSMECKRGDPNSPTPAVQSASAVSSVKLPSETTIDFLAPAQKPDELGRLGGYRILSVLGEGGMGVVFKAEDPRLKRLVALKVMKPDKASNQVAHQRFIKEGELAAALQHDHIVTIYRVDEDQGVPFLAMQFLEGESLDERLRREGKLPAEEIIRIAREAAEGLGAAHDKGLIHRDIKPANIWLETLPGAPALGRGRFGGRVKILDFGLARAVSDQSQHLTQTGMVVGTPDYMAPEQARTGQTLDGRCDLFSLGSVMYRMSTGRKPFQGDDIMGTLLALAMEDPPPARYYNPEIPPQLSDMIRWLMAKSPGDRPRSAQDVVDSLTVIERNLADGTADFPELSGQPSPSGSIPRRKDRRSTTTAPQISQALRSGSVDRPPSAPSTLSKYGLHPVEPTQTAKGVAAPKESKNAPGAVAKAPPTPALSPLLKDLVGRTESLTEIRPKVQKCPKCGQEKFTSLGWCLSCGYSPTVQENLPPKQEKPINSAWIILGGVVGVILATAVCHVTLRVSPHWMNWVRIEAGLGLAGIVIGYVWNYYCVLPYFGDHTGNLTWNPLTLLSAGVHQLPKTRWPLTAGASGITALACIAILVGDPSFWWTWKVKVPIPTSYPIEFERADSRASNSGSTTAESPKKMSKTTKSFSVVGTSGGDVILADTDILSSAYKYAGRAPMSGSIQEKLQNAKSRTEPAFNSPNLTGVTWIEPFSCDVEFSKRDDNGVVLDPAIK